MALIFVAISLAVHLLAGAAFIIGPRLGWTPPPPAKPAEVELLMVEQKGTEAGAPAQTRPEQKQQQQQQQQQKPPQESAAEPAPDAAPSKETAPPARKSEPTAKQATSPTAPTPAVTARQATPPPMPEAPKIDLNGTDSDSNAIAFNVIPASPDDRFRNRPPAYPADAARLGLHGEVALLIHVNAAGYAIGADVVQSSGSPSLDEAAIDAVRKWRFHPAIRDGKTVPNDMPFVFDFTLD